MDVDVNKYITSILSVISDWRKLLALTIVSGIIVFGIVIKYTKNEFLIVLIAIVMSIVLLTSIYFIYKDLKDRHREKTNHKDPSHRKEIIYEITNGEDESLISRGRYFIGINIGRDKIDYCLVDYDKFEKEDKCKIEKGNIPTPANFQYVNERLVEIVEILLNYAYRNNIKPISGIGLGLPGQVNPILGELVFSPGFKTSEVQPVVDNLKGSIWSKLRKLSSDLFEKSPDQISFTKDDLKIVINNDVRCSTRYLWKKYSADNMISIFAGIGLGSGIVLDGRMLYGYNFTSGEIGHTTAFNNFNIFEKIRTECKYNIKQIIDQSILKQLYLDKKNIDAEKIFELANIEKVYDYTDKFAAYLIETAAQRIAKVLLTLSNIHGIERFGIAGTVAMKNPNFLDVIKNELSGVNKICDDIFKNKLEIELSPLGDFIADYGALFLIVDSAHEKNWIETMVKLSQNC